MRQTRQNRREDRQEGQVGEDQPVARVVGDPGDLLGKEPRVEGVADRADAHDPVPGLDVAAGVPRQGADSIARLDPQSQQGVGDALGPIADLGVGRAHDRALDRSADHLAMTVPERGMVDDLVEGQRPVLHQALHRTPALPLPYRCSYKAIDARRDTQRAALVARTVFAVRPHRRGAMIRRRPDLQTPHGDRPIVAADCGEMASPTGDMFALRSRDLGGRAAG